MRTVYIKNYKYKGDLAEIEAEIEFILSDEDYTKYNDGTNIDELDTRITAEWISILERKAAFEYLKINYPKAKAGEYKPEAWEIRCITSLWGVSRTAAANCLGIDNGTLSNHINGKRKMERSTAFFMLERLGLELARPGSIKAMTNETNESKNPPHSQDVEKEMEILRFKHNKVA